MNPSPVHLPGLTGIAVATALLALLGGIGLALWMDNAAAMFLSLAQAGLAWCM